MTTTKTASVRISNDGDAQVRLRVYTGRPGSPPAVPMYAEVDLSLFSDGAAHTLTATAGGEGWQAVEQIQGALADANRLSAVWDRNHDTLVAAIQILGYTVDRGAAQRPCADCGGKQGSHAAHCPKGGAR